MPDAPCQLPVGRRLAVRHAGELAEDRHGEGRQRAQVEREVEGAALALEVLVELATRRVDAPGRAEDARAGDARQLLEPIPGISVERDRSEPAVGSRDEQVADGRVDDVEADVDEPERRRSLAEAAVEVWRDGHEAILLRMRRTPVDAAWRAASGDEPSADAIWSYERS